MTSASDTDVMTVVSAYVNDDLAYRKTDAVEVDTDLIGRGVVDSVGLFRLVGFLEDRFGLVIPPDDIVPENMGTIGVICAYVTRRMAAG